MKYLDTIIDDKLQFKGHCDYMLKKLEKKTNFLNGTDNFVFAYSRCVTSQS